MKKPLIIKEIYNCKEEQNPVYPLQKWYNEVIQKNEDEITISDVLRMIRQNLFIEIATKKTVEFLISDPFAHEEYEGQLLEHLARVDAIYLKTYADKIERIADNGMKSLNESEWMSEDDKAEYLNAIRILQMNTIHS